jgi:hypothetical protein
MGTQGDLGKTQFGSSDLTLRRWITYDGPLDGVYVYAGGNPLSYIDPTGQGPIDIWNKIVCFYYLIKCGKAIKRCRKSQECDPVKRMEGGKRSGGLAGESFINLAECADKEPCVNKLVQVCGYGIAIP